MNKSRNTNFTTSLKNLLSNHSFEFNPSQNKISIPLVERIFKKMKAGLEFDAMKVADDLIIDGHHRYIASILANKDIAQFRWPKNHNQSIFEWRDVTLTSLDYDKPSQIQYHNFNDAKRNGKDVQDIEEILNL